MASPGLRDYLAGKAIEGAVVKLYGGIVDAGPGRRDDILKQLSAAAYALADAMLVARLEGKERPGRYADEDVDIDNRLAREARRRLDWPLDDEAPTREE